jgi:hypothetical protein
MLMIRGRNRFSNADRDSFRNGGLESKQIRVLCEMPRVKNPTD